MLCIDCSHPTFCDSDSQCVETCPQGTFGAVDRSDNTTMRRCSTCELLSYVVTNMPFNYETVYMHELITLVKKLTIQQTELEGGVKQYVGYGIMRTIMMYS